MKKRLLKHGGLSGILPEVRPIFKKNPIRPRTPYEDAKENALEQGYAEGIPEPKKKGFKFERHPQPRPVITLQERIEKNIESRRPENVDESKLSEEERWNLAKDNIRREYLKEAYIKEAERLAKLDKLKAKRLAEKQKEVENKTSVEISEATRLTIPTIDSYLEGPIMRQRTEEEETILNEQRRLNRRNAELAVEEQKANEILELYHAASKFITTEEELQVAIHQAFDVDVTKFHTSTAMVAEKIFGGRSGYLGAASAENIIRDHHLSTIDGNPGLELVKDTLSGEAHKLKTKAEIAANQPN